MDLQDPWVFPALLISVWLDDEAADLKAIAIYECMLLRPADVPTPESLIVETCQLNSVFSIKEEKLLKA